MNLTDLKAALAEPRRLVLPNPWAGHIPFAGWLIQQIQPKVLVELGTHTGNSYAAFCQAIETTACNTKAFAVDTWQGDSHSGRYDDSVYQQLRAHHDPLYGRFSSLLRKTFDQALDDFASGSIDLLHIDGLHTYEAVRHDFETWLPKLSQRGVVLFHDTCVFRDDFGVHLLWQELRERYPGFNFTHSNGLGVLLVGADQAPALVAMAAGTGDTHCQLMHALFAQLGAAFELRLESQFLAGRCEHLTEAIDARDAKTLQLHGVINQAEKQSAHLYAALAEKDAQLLTLHQAIADRDASLAQKDAQLLSQQAEISRLLNSKSWRLTRPLRRARRLAERSLIPAKPAIRAVALLRQQLHRHGVIGVLRRGPYYLRALRDRPSLLLNETTQSHAPEFLTSLPIRPNLGLHPELQGTHLRGPNLAALRDRPALLPSDAVQSHAPEFLTTPGIRRNLRLHPELLESRPEQANLAVSVVIPTLNAGHEFSWLLQKLFAQKGIGRIEVVVVDSGSQDSTVQTATQAGCVVVQIPPSEFSHSHARNLGADSATGDYLLFMVQDAYPIGDHWMAGMLQFLQDHAQDNVVAASCAEYSRSDSDVMYDSMIHTHYQFLGCLHYDRIGEFREPGQASLRSQGQLSDVSCMIGRDIFQRYRYRGNYAEDLDLGIRLIQDNHRVAMLASVKVVHSHNRPAYYYLKRSFVDVIFLVNLFPDFEYAHIGSQKGLFTGILSVAVHLSRWFETPMPAQGGNAPALLRHLSDQWRNRFTQLNTQGQLHLGDARLDAWLQQLQQQQTQAQAGNLGSAIPASEKKEAQRFLDAFLGRFDHFTHFVEQAHGPLSEELSKELREAIVKIFAAAAGSALAFMYLDTATGSCSGDQALAQNVYADLKAGV